jgi:uncharacterized protein YndB with AHSA1/START domain
MLTAETDKAIRTLRIVQERQIAAPIDVVFAIVLDPPGPMSEMKLKIEAWPGGRWYRDLGDKTGHLWGHVQVIKPPKLLEIVGPMMMSYPVASHIQYRLVEENGGTKLTMIHQAMGLITQEHADGMTKGWGEIVGAIAGAAEKRAGKR